MAATGVNTNLIKKHYAKSLMLEWREQSFFEKFIGDGENSMLHQKNEMKKDKGDQVTFGLLSELSGQGVTGDSKLKGSEEPLVVYDDTVKIDQLRNGVVLEGRMAEQKAAYDLRESSKSALKRWWGRIFDEHIFRALSGETDYTFAGNTGVAPDANHIIYGGDATAKSDLDSADTLTLVKIDKAKEWAQNELVPRIRPLMIDGQETYILLIHGRAEYDLKQLAAWTQAQREAGVRGQKNPIFSGALGIWNNIVIYSHPGVRVYTDYGSGAVHASRCLFLGAQAGLVAFGKGPTWDEEPDDYNNQAGFAFGNMFGVKKSIFNSKDYGVIAIDVAAAKP